MKICTIKGKTMHLSSFEIISKTYVNEIIWTSKDGLGVVIRGESVLPTINGLIAPIGQK